MSGPNGSGTKQGTSFACSKPKIIGHGCDRPMNIFGAVEVFAKAGHGRCQEMVEEARALHKQGKVLDLKHE